MRVSMLEVSLLSMFTACGPRIEATTVNGSVEGVTIEAPDAVFIEDTGLFGAKRQTVIVARGPEVCARIGAVSTPGPSPVGQRSVFVGDGGVELVREPALIVQSTGDAYFDTGRGTERLRGSRNGAGEGLALLDIAEQSTSTLRARYSATFVGGIVTGEVVARLCGAINPGCASTGPGLLLGLLAVTVCWARRAKKPPTTV